MNPPMTQQGETAAPQRTALSRLVGRVVTVEATYGNEAWHTDVGLWLYIIRDVYVYPSAQFSHLWLELPEKPRRRLYEGTRFSFRGEVIEYQRSNGTENFGVKYIGGLNVVR